MRTYQLQPPTQTLIYLKKQQFLILKYFPVLPGDNIKTITNDHISPASEKMINSTPKIKKRGSIVIIRGGKFIEILENTENENLDLRAQRAIENNLTTKMRVKGKMTRYRPLETGEVRRFYFLFYL